VKFVHWFLIVHLTFLSCVGHMATKGMMAVNEPLGKTRKCMIVAMAKVLSQHLRGATNRSDNKLLPRWLASWFLNIPCKPLGLPFSLSSYTYISLRPQTQDTNSVSALWKFVKAICITVKSFRLKLINNVILLKYGKLHREYLSLRDLSPMSNQSPLGPWHLSGNAKKKQQKNSRTWPKWEWKLLFERSKSVSISDRAPLRSPWKEQYRYIVVLMNCKTQYRCHMSYMEPIWMELPAA
jgi:hypothetical protein